MCYTAHKYSKYSYGVTKMFRCCKRGCNTLIEKRGYCQPHRKEYNDQYYIRDGKVKRVKLTEVEKKQRKAESAKRYANTEEGKKVLLAAHKRYIKKPEVRAKERIRKDVDRMRRNNVSGAHTAKQWLDLCTKYNNKCLCCGLEKPLTKDHIIPISKGGTDNIDNIQPLCNECNATKATKTIDYR